MREHLIKESKIFNLGISQRSFHIPHLLPLLLFPPHLPVQVELSRSSPRRAGNNTWRSGFCLFKEYLHLVAPDVFPKFSHCGGIKVVWPWSKWKEICLRHHLPMILWLNSGALLMSLRTHVRREQLLRKINFLLFLLVVVWNIHWFVRVCHHPEWSAKCQAHGYNGINEKNMPYLSSFIFMTSE